MTKNEFTARLEKILGFDLTPVEDGDVWELLDEFMEEILYGDNGYVA